MSVDIENMRTWVARLRDPESKQARKRLRRQDGSMCCLAHANDVSGLGRWTRGVGNTGSYVVDSVYKDCLLHPVVAQWLGLDDPNPKLLDRTGGFTRATVLNDVDKYTLVEIADAIERTWPEVREEVPLAVWS